MESTSYFESANTLVILAFEEEIDLRFCRRLPFERSADKSLRTLRCRCKFREGGRCQYRGSMHVRLDSFMSILDGGALQRQGVRSLCHPILRIENNCLGWIS